MQLLRCLPIAAGFAMVISSHDKSCKAAMDIIFDASHFVVYCAGLIVGSFGFVVVQDILRNKL